MADHKPLPAIPSSKTTITTLCTDARVRRAALIRHFLTNDDDLRRSAVAWTEAFEAALDALSDAAHQDDWIAGIRKARAEKKEDRGEDGGTEEVDSASTPFEQVVKRAAAAIPPSPDSPPKHLLLCIAPLGSRSSFQQPEDNGYEFVHSSLGCVFSPGEFTLQEESSVLYGLNTWDWPNDATLKLVGGSFVFKGVRSPVQHDALKQILRLAIYIHLSLLLEQNFLYNSSVKLIIPRHDLLRPLTSPISSTSSEISNASSDKSKNRPSFIPSGIFNFFSKKGFGHALSHPSRGSEDSAESGRSRLSFDFPRTESPRPSMSPNSPISSLGTHVRRFSFISDALPSLSSFGSPVEPDKDDERRFGQALERVERNKDFLSASIGVTFDPPALLAAIAKKEERRRDPTENSSPFRLSGDEKTGLTSVLGWESGSGSKGYGKGMCGVAGFVRHQQFPVLLTQHVPAPAVTPPTDSNPEIVKPDASAEISILPCGRPRIVTYRYYSYTSDKDSDRGLGDYIVDLANTVTEERGCSVTGCTRKVEEHTQRYMHGGVRIDVSITPEVEPETRPDDKTIQAWLSCSVCHSKSKQRAMNDGVSLMSFGKMLELLVYSPSLCRITPSICDHTRPPSMYKSALPETRFNINRHFRYRNCTLSFVLSEIKDIFDLRVPRLQIVKVGTKGPGVTRNVLNQADDEEVEIEGEEDEKKLLRREIRDWWACVADHLDTLEDKIAAGETIKGPRKALPRLPSVDDAYEDLSSTDLSGLPPLPSSAPPTPGVTSENRELFPQPPSEVSSISSDSSSLSSSTSSIDPSRERAQPKNPIELLEALRQAFQTIEQSLYFNVASTPTGKLNDTRRAFLSAARGAERRLEAWQKKHSLSQTKDKLVTTKNQPEWMNASCHVPPGCNVIVREGDWGSIIALTLSTAEYRKELNNMSIVRTSSTSTANSATDSVSGASVAGTPPVASQASASSFFSATGAGYKLFGGGSSNKVDPDDNSVQWDVVEGYSAVITRKEHPKDATSLLSIRDVLRQKPPAIIDSTSGPGVLSASRFASLGNKSVPSTSTSGKERPPTAWSSKPNIGISTDVADGELGAVDLGDGQGTLGESVGKRLKQELEASTAALNGEHPRGSSTYSTFSSWGMGGGGSVPPSATVATRARSNSSASKDSDETVGPDPLLLGSDAGAITPIAEAPPRASRFTSMTNGLSHAMRFVLNQSTELEPRPTTPNNKHALLGASEVEIDDRPHIKYDWMIGKRMKFSCTVYYARQFDSLRRRCGIGSPDASGMESGHMGVFLKSLSHSRNWAAEGGKSKSNFWKTSDDRFIIKTLVNAWNVADLQVLIELAPSYFRYIDSTASKATVLAKLVGFYTVEIRNLETGAVQSKADLLVMENLFYQRKIEKTFDLKGIQGRKVKAKAGEEDQGQAKTLFDGEWIEGQQKTLTLVRPYSKMVIREAIKNDADFLAKSNIMDYSMLLGIDTEKKQIACGLVDTIGSFTFAKTLEYKAKQGLQMQLNAGAAKEVTVMPPNEYQERFTTALDGYFLACPDKWTTNLDSEPEAPLPNCTFDAYALNNVL